MSTASCFIPPSGHSLASTLREIDDADGDAVRIELEPQSPFSGDPEFDSTDLSAWTQANGSNADAIDAHTSLKSHLFFNLNATSCDWDGSTRSGPFEYQTISGNFDVYAKVMIGDIRAYHHIGILAQSTSDDTDWMLSHFVVSGGGGFGPPNLLPEKNSTNASSSSKSGSVISNAPHVGAPLWLRLKRATNDFNAYHSLDGKNWTEMGTTTTRSDFSSDAKLGIAAGNVNTSNAHKSAVDFIRTWPPYDTTSPTSSIVVDSGVNGTTWDMSTFNALINSPLDPFGIQSTIGLGTLKYQYGAGNSDPPSLNGSWLTESQMQSESDPTGRYLKLSVQYNSANGYELATFCGATIDAIYSSSKPFFTSPGRFYRFAG